MTPRTRGDTTVVLATVAYRVATSARLMISLPLNEHGECFKPRWPAQTRLTVFVAPSTARVRQTSGHEDKKRPSVSGEAGVAFQLVKMHAAFTINQRAE